MLGTGDGGSSTKIEPVVFLLTALVLIFTVALILVASSLSSDGQTFQIIAGLDTSFAGALLMRIKPRGPSQDEPPLTSVVRTVQTHTEAKAEEKKDG